MVNSASLWKLRLSMAGTLALIIGVSTLSFAAILWWFEALDLYTLVVMVGLFNVLQWLIAPYLVNMMYGVKQVEPGNKPQIHSMLDRISQRSGIKTPKLMISSLGIPNAFAYGSPLTGNMVAITDGLMKELEPEEIEAVIGHEVGHLKHRDMQVMMVVSFLPSLFYIVARSFLWSSWFGGRDRRSDNGSALALVGGLSMVVYFVLTLLNLGMSRQREYFADKHASEVIDDGARKLSEGLAKISSGTWKRQAAGEKVAVSGFKTLFIADPDRAGLDVAELQADKYGSADSHLVEAVLTRRVSGFDSFLELFSTHPNIVKRLKALQES